MILAERQFLKTLESGCSAPVAVYCALHNSELSLTGMYADSEGNMARGRITGGSGRPEHAGESLALRLKAALARGEVELS